MRTWILLFVLAGCGGTTSQQQDSDAGTHDGGGGDGGCIQATERASCTKGEQACSIGGDVCCTGFLDCVGGVWTKEYPGCACQPNPGFTCGSETCSAFDYCSGQPGAAGADGGVPPTTYQCMPLNSCQQTPTCDCVKQLGTCGDAGVSSCDDTKGHVEITCTGQ